MNHARELWQRIETIHAVTYFAPESIAAAKTAGLRGFWMGYYGFRAAPLGAVQPGAVEAVFANFAPDMIRRSIPDAWEFADPTSLVAARAAAAAVALRRLVPDIASVAEPVNATLADVVDAATPIGRPLFAANRDIAELEDPVAQLWQHCTTLREHRGDGHVAALTVNGIDGCEAHQLHAASQRLPEEVFQDNRGWSDEQWQAAARRLRDRGLLDRQAITEQGRRVHERVEQTTDDLAQQAIDAAITPDEAEGVIDALTSTAERISASGDIPFPNPMGLRALAAPD